MNSEVSGAKSALATSLIKGTSAAKKLNLLKGYEGVWINARRSNAAYILNKLISVGIAVFFAIAALSVKRATITYSNQMAEQDPKDNGAFHIRVIFWFMFIYYSLQAMDELIELFSVMN